MTRAQEKLLVVDDDENNRDMLSRRLMRQGYLVEVAEDGSEALRKIAQAHYDLVLLDQMMPGMSGLDLLQLLRATYSPSELPVIMVTAVDQSETVVEALHGGANDYVTKPVDMPVVTARIQAQLSRSKSDRQVREREQRYALAARGSSDEFFDWDLISNRVHVFSHSAALTGVSESEELEPEAWLGNVHPDDAGALRTMLQLHLENKTAEFQHEYRIRLADGQYQWVLCRGSALRSADGKPLRMAGSITNIAASKVIDAVTGLGNRQMLLERLAALAAMPPYAIVMLDLDGFKVVNDSFGLSIGDRILVEIASRVRTVAAEMGLTGSTSLSRIGGDEFTILLERLTGPGEATALADGILTSLLRPMTIDGFRISIGGSLGIAIETEPNAKPQDVVRDAELAMYRAKELGKNRWEIFDTKLRDRAFTKMTLGQDLRYAIERGQMRVVYQPKVNLQTRGIVGFEALMRWNHPERGLLSPVEFISLAEETGLIVPLGEWILNEACRQLKTWQDTHPQTPPLSMNVNVSVRQLGDLSLVERVAKILEETGIAKDTLKLELTESTLMMDLESSRTVLTKLQSMHIGLKLDDFGTGYSSLSYLRALHFDSLKIDRSFVAKMAADPETHAIVETIVKLAHTLDMTVVAEGIEEAEQVEDLLRLGCNTGQGYFFSRPVDAAAAEKLLDTSFDFSTSR